MPRMPVMASEEPSVESKGTHIAAGPKSDMEQPDYRSQNLPLDKSHVPTRWNTEGLLPVPMLNMQSTSVPLSMPSIASTQLRGLCSWLNAHVSNGQAEHPQSNTHTKTAVFMWWGFSTEIVCPEKQAVGNRQS